MHFSIADWRLKKINRFFNLTFFKISIENSILFFQKIIQNSIANSIVNSIEKAYFFSLFLLFYVWYIFVFLKHSQYVPYFCPKERKLSNPYVFKGAIHSIARRGYPAHRRRELSSHEEGGYPAHEEEGGYPAHEEEGGYPAHEEEGGFPAHEEGGYPAHMVSKQKPSPWCKGAIQPSERRGYPAQAALQKKKAFTWWKTWTSAVTIQLHFANLSALW